MKKLLIIPFIALLLCGCENEVDGKNSSYRTYCDKEYGVEYIRFGAVDGGITIRLDSEGNVIHCEH